MPSPEIHIMGAADQRVERNLSPWTAGKQARALNAALYAGGERTHDGEEDFKVTRLCLHWPIKRESGGGGA